MARRLTAHKIREALRNRLEFSLKVSSQRHPALTPPPPLIEGTAATSRTHTQPSPSSNSGATSNAAVKSSSPRVSSWEEAPRAINRGQHLQWRGHSEGARVAPCHRSVPSVRSPTLSGSNEAAGGGWKGALPVSPTEITARWLHTIGPATAPARARAATHAGSEASEAAGGAAADAEGQQQRQPPRRPPVQRLYSRAHAMAAPDGGGGFVVRLAPWGEERAAGREGGEQERGAGSGAGAGEGPREDAAAFVFGSQSPTSEQSAAGGNSTAPQAASAASTGVAGPAGPRRGASASSLRLLQTPAQRLIRLPSEALAAALAAEWEWQAGARLRPYTMPLMTLVCTAVDRVPGQREAIIQQLLRFLHTDCILCRADAEGRSHPLPHEAETSLRSAPPPGPLLHEEQARMWDPILDWAEEEFRVRPVASSALVPPNQPDKVVRALFRALNQLDNFQLAAVDSLSSSARSLLLALATARGHLPVEAALEAMRVEEEFQISRWGMVEGGHDIDVSDLRVKVLAASVLLRLLQAN